MQRLSVLISGAGIAGMTLAHWLARHGTRVTVVERSAGQRSSGSPVDVRGEAVAIAERMGILPRLRQAATDVAGLRFIDARGQVVARVDTRAVQQASGRHDVEIARGDLSTILQAASQDSAEILFDDAIRTLDQDTEGVDVTFERTAPRRFDLVVGADGLHSGVRRLVFGPERAFVHHAGLYVATLPLSDVDAGIDRDVTLFNVPGRLAAIHPARTRPLAAFIFWRPAVAGLDHRDTEHHRRLVEATYRADGWYVPRLLAEVRTTPDLYFDAVSRVQLPTWSSGRVVVVGDAASCVSLLGDGSTLAMIGASTLATALAEHHGAHERAFGEYELRQRRRAASRQRLLGLAAWLLVPRTRTALTVRNAALRLAPVVTATAWARRRASRLRLSRSARTARHA